MSSSQRFWIIWPTFYRIFRTRNFLSIENIFLILPTLFGNGGKGRFFILNKQAERKLRTDGKDYTYLQLEDDLGVGDYQ